MQLLSTIGLRKFESSSNNLVIWIKLTAIRHAFPSSLVFHKHIGQDRYSEKEFLRKRAIVFTTYATLATEVRRGASYLSNINWFRIVLDEGTIALMKAKPFLYTNKIGKSKPTIFEIGQQNSILLWKIYPPRTVGVSQERLYRMMSKTWEHLSPFSKSQF